MTAVSVQLREADTDNMLLGKQYGSAAKEERAEVELRQLTYEELLQFRARKIDGTAPRLLRQVVEPAKLERRATNARALGFHGKS